MSFRPLLYCNRNKSQDSYFEFEGGATLPLFWMTLLSEEVINKLKPKLDYVENLSEKEYEIFNALVESVSYFELEIEIENFTINSKKGMDYISSLYPDYLPLYKDFIKFIDPRSKKSLILINIFDFFQETFNSDKTIQFLLESMQPIWQNKLYAGYHQAPALIVGYYEERFACYSKVYSDWIRELENQAVQRESNQNTLKYKIKHKLIPKMISRISSIIMALFAVTSWHFYKKEGLFEFTTLGFISLTLLMFYLTLKLIK